MRLAIILRRIRIDWEKLWEKIKREKNLAWSLM